MSGELTVDTGIGWRVRPLGPLAMVMAADAETVFDVIAAPYLGRTARAPSNEIEVLERSRDMVLAATARRLAAGWWPRLRAEAAADGWRTPS